MASIDATTDNVTVGFTDHELVQVTSERVEAVYTKDRPSPAAEPGTTGWETELELAGEWNRTAPWRQEVQRRRTLLYDDLARLELSKDQCDQRKALFRLLDDADAATQARVGITKWWWGTEIERSWARLREVEERTVDLLPESELLARAADASARAAFYLKADDKRSLDFEAIRGEAVKTPDKLPPRLRRSILDVVRAAHTQADRAAQESRYLRNRLLLASAVCVLFSTLLVAAALLFGNVRLLPAPEDWSGSHWMLLSVVMLVGAVGSLFTVIPTHSQMSPDFSPFNLPLAQAVLKITFAPLTALFGLALVSTEALSNFRPATMPALIVLALVFGAGQQAVTRIVDRRADEILTAVVPTADGGSGT